MTAAIGERRREVARLKRAIAYYCGVVVRTDSRDCVRRAHAAIRQLEQQLQRTLAAPAALNVERCDD